MSELLNILAAVIGLVAAIVPVLYASGGLPVSSVLRRRDYTFERQVDEELRDPDLSESTRWRAYGALLKGSRADPRGVPIVRALPDPQAMEDYIASESLLTFDPKRAWFGFAAMYGTPLRRAVWRGVYLAGYFVFYILALLPPFAYELGWATRRAPVASVLLWAVSLLAVAFACLLLRRRLTRTEAFLERVEQYRPRPGRWVPGFDGVPSDTPSGNDDVMALRLPLLEHGEDASEAPETLR